MCPGIEQELFVHPERISSQLICPICTNVLDNPVITPQEHMFCEDELIEWMTRSTLCPITKAELDPSTIRPAGRIIVNMLAELERYCVNRAEGCKWTGQNCNLTSHLKTCKFKSKEALINEIADKEATIKQMEQQLADFERKYGEVKAENLRLRSRNEQYLTRIRVYEAFHEGGGKPTEAGDKDPTLKSLKYGAYVDSDSGSKSSSSSSGGGGGGGDNIGSKLCELDDDSGPQESALQKINRLRKLESFRDN